MTENGETPVIYINDVDERGHVTTRCHGTCHTSCAQIHPPTSSSLTALPNAPKVTVGEVVVHKTRELVLA
jgi:hypothetical protein